ncbi:hypothetical protein V8G54_029072 [Vigna mungo]|uniref:Zinc finger, CCHC-type n=1 Tax=Vigna mungo TaxID=3915 RepID=A0AAQ3MTT7_VIGMU
MMYGRISLAVGFQTTCQQDNKSVIMSQTYLPPRSRLEDHRTVEINKERASKSNIFSKMTTIREISANFHKLDKFEGVGFRRWQKKMHFLLSALNVAYVLSSPPTQRKRNQDIGGTTKKEQMGE